MQPTCPPAELVAANHTVEEVAEVIGADELIYQDVDDMVSAITEGTDIEELEVSCFTGEYVTGDVLQVLGVARGEPRLLILCAGAGA